MFSNTLGRRALLAYAASLFLALPVAARAQDKKEEGGKKATITVEHDGENPGYDVTVFVGNVKDTDIKKMTITVTDKAKNKIVFDQVRIRDESKGTGRFTANGCTVFITNKDGKTITPGDKVEITVETGKTITAKNIGQITIRRGKESTKRIPDTEFTKPNIKIEKGEEPKEKECRLSGESLVTITRALITETGAPVPSRMVTLSAIEWSVGPGDLETGSLTDYAVPLPSIGLVGSANPTGEPEILTRIPILPGYEGYWVYVRAHVVENGADTGVCVWAVEILPDVPAPFPTSVTDIGVR